MSDPEIKKAIEVLDRSDQLAKWLGELPRFTYGEDGSWERRRDTVAALKTKRENLPTGPARIRETPVTTTISMMGYQASGTAGLEAACQNWISQVRRKLQGAALKGGVADE